MSQMHTSYSISQNYCSSLSMNILQCSALTIIFQECTTSDSKYLKVRSKRNIMGLVLCLIYLKSDKYALLYGKLPREIVAIYMF